MEPRDRIIVALDCPVTQAIGLIQELHEHVGWVKVGLELITGIGLTPLLSVAKMNDVKLFWDGKFNDIPNTVEKASEATQRFGIQMLNVHALAGIDSMRAAKRGAGSKCKVLAVTLLTSLAERDLKNIGIDKSPEALITDLVEAAVTAEVDGIICSPADLEFLSNYNLLRVTPGVRPIWAAKNDQKRVTTPSEAIAAGADMLVIGRPISSPPLDMTPVEAAKKVLVEIS